MKQEATVYHCVGTASFLFFAWMHVRGTQIKTGTPKWQLIEPE
jgi:hypothetical protein